MCLLKQNNPVFLVIFFVEIGKVFERAESGKESAHFSSAQGRS